MNRPKDIDGTEIVMGPWYWATNRRGDVIGTGKFAATIGFDEPTFYINGTGYAPSSFTFKRHCEPPPGVTRAELVAAVADMRAAQKAYFKSRDPDSLQTAKILEYAVNKLVAAIKNPPAPNLFG